MVALRWGILSTADIGVRKVVPAIMRSANSRVVAIALRSLERARAIAGDLGIPSAYGSYAELLADPNVDAIYNPLPNHLHVPWTVQAADAGKHVLCEKPLAMTAHEARTLVAARDRNRVHVAEAFMVRSHPQWHAARDIVASGRIGPLRLVIGHFSYYRVDPNDIRSKAEMGGGALMDIGCYPITLSRWLFGREPERVIGLVELDPALGVDRLDSCLLNFGTAQASFTCSGQLVPYQRMHMLGTTGRIEVEIPFNAPNDAPTRVFVDDGRVLGGRGAILEFPTVDQYVLQADDFAAAVAGVRPVPVTLEDSIANMAVLDALFRSATTGRWEAPV